MEPVNVTIIYYSATGTVHALARAVAEGAEKAGAEVRLRKVRELAPREIIDAVPAWSQHMEQTASVAEVSHEDVAWADVVLFGTPARFGNMAGPLKAFLDTTGPLWQAEQVAGKVCSGVVASSTPHGGQESELLALGNVFYHWGETIVPPGYTDPANFRSGNLYGT